jgi:2-polyprenyl-3-methyl-5-hydroxy-6-metoxy-1,4-benzoquinol methylase
MNWLKKVFLKEENNESVIYDYSFFKEGWFEGWDVMRPILCELLAIEPKWKSVLDFGCGPGVMIDYMSRREYQYIGCDYSDEARQIYLERYGLNPEKYKQSLKECMADDFDVFLSFDVFEHLSDAEIRLLLIEIKDIPELFLNISRAKHIAGHINIKSDRKWIKFLEKEGYEYNKVKTGAIRQRYLELRPEASDKWNENIFVFKKV